MPRISYWRGVVGAEALIADHHESLLKLLSGTYVANDLEKLRGNSLIYSLRLSGKARLLFTTLTIANVKYIHLLEYLPDHEYTQSHFLRSGVLRRYLIKNQDTFDDATIFTFDALAEAPDELRAEDDDEVELGLDTPPLALDYFNGQFIRLSPIQLEAVSLDLKLLNGSPLPQAEGVTFPALISGPAGSGKSCVSLILIESFVQQMIHHLPAELDAPMHIAYVASSLRLINEMQREWREHPISKILPPMIQIHFKIYDELLTVPGKTKVDQTYFNHWFELFSKKFHLDCTPDTLYQSFRLCSGFTEEGYSQQSKRHVLLAESEAGRKTVFTLYQQYLKYLGTHQVYDPAFENIQGELQYALMVVDEGQDLSTQQLYNCYRLTQAHRFVVFRDNHQSLWDEYSKEPFLKWMFHQHGLSHVVRQISLEGTYRCPARIARVANVFLLAKYELTTGKQDLFECAELKSVLNTEGEQGKVALIRPRELSDQSWFQADKTTAFAVVTLKEYIDEAKRLFKTELVFETAEIKGLQYPEVVAYRLLSSPQFLSICSRLPDIVVTSAPKNRPKTGRGDFTVGPVFHQPYTALTRASRSLVIVEDETLDNQKILLRLRQAMHEAEIVKDDVSVEVAPISEISWLEEAIKQYELGNSRVAEGIVQSRLTVSEQETYLIRTKLSATVAAPTIFCPATEKPAQASADRGSPQPKIKTKIEPLVEFELFDHLCENYTPDTLQAFFRLDPSHLQQSRANKSKKKQSVRILDLILLNDDHARIFVDVFSRHADLKDKMIQIIFSGARMEAKKAYVALTEQTQVLLISSLLPHDSKLLKNDLIFDWIKTVLVASPCLLHWFTLSELHVLYFQEVIHIDPSLLRMIPAEFWAHSDPIEPNLTPFLKFIDTEIGVGLLYRYTKLVPMFFKKLPDNILQLPLTKKSGVIENLTPLYLLASSRKWVQLLTNLLSKHLRLFKNTTVAWGLALTSKAKEEAYKSALFRLVETDEEQQLLNVMLNFIPEVLKLIPCSVWAAPVMVHEDVSRTVLSILSKGSDSGLKVLKFLVEAQIPGVIKGIALTAGWTMVHRETLFLQLTSRSIGHEVLVSLMRKNPDVLLEMDPEVWMKPQSVMTDEYFNNTALSWLLSSTNGRVVFLEILESYPQVFAKIPHKAWSQPLLASSGKYVNYTPLLWILRRAKDINFLEALYRKVPEVFQKFTPEAWGYPTTEASGLENVSVLYYMCSSSLALEILLDLLKYDKEIFRQIPIEAWTRALCLSAVTLLNDTPVCALVRGEGGRGIFFLQRLFELLPEVIVHMDPSVWWLPLSAAKGVDKNLTPLFDLLRYVECNDSSECSEDSERTESKSATDFLEPDSSVWVASSQVEQGTNSPCCRVEGDRNEYPADDSGSSVGTERDEGEIFETRPGIAFLLSLLQHAPHIIAAIPEAAWITSVGEFPGNTALYMLTSTNRAHKLFIALIDSVPWLVLSWPEAAWRQPKMGTSSFAMNSPLDSLFSVNTAYSLTILEFLMTNAQWFSIEDRERFKSLCRKETIFSKVGFFAQSTYDSDLQSDLNTHPDLS